MQEIDPPNYGSTPVKLSALGLSQSRPLLYGAGLDSAGYSSSRHRKRKRERTGLLPKLSRALQRHLATRQKNPVAHPEPHSP